MLSDNYIEISPGKKLKHYWREIWQYRELFYFGIKDILNFEVAQKKSIEYGWMASKEGVIKPKLE